MRFAITVAVFSLVPMLACSHSRHPCQTAKNIGIVMSDAVPLQQDLNNILQVFIEANCRCEFPIELKRRMTFGDRVMGEEYELGESACLGELMITSFDDSVPNLISVELERVDTSREFSPRGDRFLLTAVLSNDQWFLYWPERVQDGMPHNEEKQER